MNWEYMKKNVGCRVQLVPRACRLDELGQKLPTIDDDWVIRQVAVDGIQIANERTSHNVTLGKDHIHHFTSNPDRTRGDLRYGFLTLHVQLFMQGLQVGLRPNARPGEPVEPDVITIAEKWVDINYPFQSGIQAKIEVKGYEVKWCSDPTLSRKIDLEDWEIVVEPDARGVLTKFRLKGYPSQTLVKKRLR
jgi:hypothetical protein